MDLPDSAGRTRLPFGLRVTGEVKKVCPFGFFAELGDGRAGLCLIVDAFRAIPGKELKLYYAIGEVCELRVLVDAGDGRIRLTDCGLELSDEAFASNHPFENSLNV